MRALLPHAPRGAQIDAEDLGQVNPCDMDEALLRMIQDNVARLTLNFSAAGYTNVIAASVANTYSDYVTFRALLPRDINVFVVQLRASRAVRDKRRTSRAKPTSSAWRDHVDRVDPEDTTLAMGNPDYRLIVIDSDHLTISDTVIHIVAAIPEIYPTSTMQ